VVKIVGISYGGEIGFNHAIELASEALGNVKFIQEKKLIGKIVLTVTFVLATILKCGRNRLKHNGNETKLLWMNSW